MSRRHPLEHIAPGALRYWMIPLAALSALLLAALPALIPARETHTLLDLVEAGSAVRASEVLSHWSEADRLRMAHAVGFDYLLNPAYWNVVALACIWAGRRLGQPLGALGPGLAWLCWSAILTNVAENVALYRMVAGDVTTPWPVIASGAHYWAGLVIVASVLYVMAATVLWRLRR